jgi:Spy/CpxP family protein refolding chaperone
VNAKLVAVTLILAGALAAGAQGPSGPPPKGPGGPGEGRQRGEAFKMVEAYFLSNLQESLALTDEQYVKLRPSVKKLQAERRDQMERRGRAMMQLRDVLQSGKATEAVVVEALKELKRLEAEGPAAIHKAQEAVDAQLTPVQQAKYRLTELEVERKVRELLVRGARAREGGRRPGRGQPGQPDGEVEQP